MSTLPANFMQKASIYTTSNTNNTKGIEIRLKLYQPILFVTLKTFLSNSVASLVISPLAVCSSERSSSFLPAKLFN